MASVDLKVGEYKIAKKTQHTFTFWWPDAGLKSFFDVSIMPEADAVNPTISPLIEVKRVRGVALKDRKTVPTLDVTLQNDNDKEVKFFASHVHVA
jgi:hypothetical protein